MGTCDACGEVFPEGVVECSLYACHYKVCDKCIVEQKGKVKHWCRREVSSMLQVWCFYCRQATSPGDTVYGKQACDRCLMAETNTPTRKMPKVSVDWVDPDPPSPLPEDPPGVHRAKQIQKCMANTVADTLVDETVLSMMFGGSPWSGGRRRGRKHRK